MQITRNFPWQAQRWWASWQGGIEALPAPGHGCLTAFQSLERHNGSLKQSLPSDYHRLGMVAVNDRLLAGGRALQKSRGWVTATEQLPEQVSQQEDLGRRLVEHRTSRLDGGPCFRFTTGGSHFLLLLLLLLLLSSSSSLSLFPWSRGGVRVVRWPTSLPGFALLPSSSSLFLSLFPCSRGRAQWIWQLICCPENPK